MCRCILPREKYKIRNHNSDLCRRIRSRSLFLLAITLTSPHHNTISSRTQFSVRHGLYITHRMCREFLYLISHARQEKTACQSMALINSCFHPQLDCLKVYTYIPHIRFRNPSRAIRRRKAFSSCGFTKKQTREQASNYLCRWKHSHRHSPSIERFICMTLCKYDSWAVRIL